MNLAYLRTQIHHFFYTLLGLPRAWQFMVNYRLWRGLREYGWVMRGLVVAGIALGIYVYSDTADWFSSHRQEPLSAVFIGEESLLYHWYEVLAASLTDGTLNIFTLVLLEVVIYHFMRRTLTIVLQRENKNLTSFKPFLDAQVRMFVLSILITIFTKIIGGFSDGVLRGVLGWKSGEWYVTGALNIFFLGFLIVDNYNEQFELRIEESWRQTWRNYVGICFGLGLPLWFMLKVPLLGTVLGPLAVSVTAAIVLREISDLHLVGYKRNAKEQAKYDKKMAKAAAKLAKKEAKLAKRVARKNRKQRSKSTV